MADSIGLKLDRWQQADITDILAEQDDGRWAAFESGLLVPRQNGKGAELEAIEIADLFLFGAQLVIHTAHEFKTAQEAFRRVLFWVENTDWLRKKVAHVRTSHGEEGIELISGQRLRFLARSGGSGRGFTCDRLIYDEAYELSEETVAASLPTMAAVKNPSVIYASSAALAKSTVLRKVMQRGRREPENRNDSAPEKDEQLCYIEYSADPKADLDDRAMWVQANPATESGRIKVEFIAKERAAMSEVAFARERLGILDESQGGTVIDMDLWATRADTLSYPMDPVSFAIDVNPDASFTSIAVAGTTASGRVHVEVVERKRGTGWVVDRIEELVRDWKPSSVTLDAVGPVGQLLPAFAERGVHIDVVSMKEYGHACGLFKSMAEDGRLVHKAQTGLDAALEAARKRDLDRDAGLWGWHRRDTTDITPLVASTLAVYAHAKSAGVDNSPEDNRVIVFR